MAGMTDVAKKQMMAALFIFQPLTVCLHEWDISFDAWLDREQMLFGRQCSNRQPFDATMRARVYNPQPGYTFVHVVVYRGSVPIIEGPRLSMKEGDWTDVNLKTYTLH